MVNYRMLLMTVAAFVLVNIGSAESPPLKIEGLKCPKNETWAECSTNCENTCGVDTQMCNMACGIPKCQCDADFYRNSTGSCVKNEDCDGVLTIMPVLDPVHPDCSVNETWTECSSACEPKCSGTENMACIQSCQPPSCQCKGGMFRGPSGRCIEQVDCKYDGTGGPAPLPEGPLVGACPKNESWTECSSACERSCSTSENQMCTMECRPPSCQCDAEHYRNASGTCVLKSDCTAVEKTSECKIATCEAGSKCVVVDLTCDEEPCPSEEICVPDDTDESPSITCENVDCVSGKICVMQEVQCIKAPCNKVPFCVDPGTDSNATLPAECAAVSCMYPSTCEVVNGTAMCKEADSIGCETVDCVSGQVCIMQEVHCIKAPCNKIPTCVIPEPNDQPTLTCETMDCRDGFCCVMKTVQCKKAPCHKAPVCVANSDEHKPSCKTVKCSAGHKCILEQVQCFAPPCYPVPQCVPDNTTGDPHPCAAMMCITESICMVQNGTGVCVPRNQTTPSGNETTCDNFPCGAGEECRIESVNCFVPPCPPTHAICVPSSNATLPAECATVSCMFPSTCEVVNGAAMCTQKNATCGSNEVWDGCGTTCEPKCGSKKPAMCIEICAPGACKCSDGFFRHKNGNCVAESQCKQNWHDNNNGTTNETDITCDNVRCAAGTTCQLIQARCVGCKPMAKCLSDNTNSNSTTTPQPELTCSTVKCAGGTKCVIYQPKCTGCQPIVKCVSEGTTGDNSTEVDNGCDDNEEPTQCVPNCQDTCHGIQKCHIKKGMMGEMSCQPGCVCKKKYRRNAEGKCVRNRSCYLHPGCHAHETYTQCMPCYEQTCESMETTAKKNATALIQVKDCKKKCRSGCTCDIGFFRDSETGKCVQQCS